MLQITRVITKYEKTFESFQLLINKTRAFCMLDPTEEIEMK